MEYLQGTTLLDLFNQGGPLAPDLVVRVLSQASAALAAAHEAGIIHRDLKPSNLYLTANPDMLGGWQVKVLDFGVAKLVEDDPFSDSTRTGTVLGSPQFMSPEQCLDSKRVDGRTDVFALAAIGYLMLTGELPFKGESLGQIIAAHMDATPTPIRELRPEVPGALEGALTRALARAREERFETMAAFDEALRAVALPAQASPPTAFSPDHPLPTGADTLDPSTAVHFGDLDELFDAAPAAADLSQDLGDPFVDDAPTVVDLPGRISDEEE